jgi:hypothetical protein
LILKEKGNALKLAWKADLIIDGVAVWTRSTAPMSDSAYTTAIKLAPIDSQFHCFHAFFLCHLEEERRSSLV